MIKLNFNLSKWITIPSTEKIDYKSRNSNAVGFLWETRPAIIHVCAFIHESCACVHTKKKNHDNSYSFLCKQKVFKLQFKPWHFLLVTWKSCKHQQVKKHKITNNKQYLSRWKYWMCYPKEVIWRMFRTLK